MLCTAICLSACGIGIGDEPPLVMAHRAAPSLWPENSRTAVQGSLEKGYPGIEIDLVLTSDHVPVVAHDPWIDPKYCERADGSPFEERVLVSDLSLDELVSDYVCGGIADADFPDAQVVADTPMTLDDLIELLRPHPNAWIQLDVKYEPGLTPEPEVYAEEILSRWTAAELPNPWYVSANIPELLTAFRSWMGERPLTAVLIYPRFPPDSNSTTVALTTESLGALGIRDSLGAAKKAEADGIAWPFELIDWHAAEIARRDGMQVMVWTVNDEAVLERFCSWPVDVLITDFPERAPCLP
ncbi:MAG: glycerophosphodiester phosphodiesterase [Myxococcota bacterium]